jgi:hypothetical protein
VVANHICMGRGDVTCRGSQSDCLTLREMAHVIRWRHGRRTPDWDWEIRSERVSVPMCRERLSDGAVLGAAHSSAAP